MAARVTAAIFAAVAILVSASGAFAGEPPPAPEAKASPPKAAPANPGAVTSSPAQPAPGASAAGGLVVFIDPATGKVRQPDAGEIGRLVSPPGERQPLVYGPLLVKTGPGGAVGVVLDSSFESYMVVTKTPDGKLVTGCVTGRAQAEAAVAGSAKPAATGGGKEAGNAP